MSCNNVLGEECIDSGDGSLGKADSKCVPTELASIAESQELISAVSPWHWINVGDACMHHEAGVEVQATTVFIVSNECLVCVCVCKEKMGAAALAPTICHAGNYYICLYHVNMWAVISN